MKYARMLLTAALAAVMAACASIGRPEGGARDETPPVFLRSDPAPGSLNFDKKRINIYFDENIKVEDVMNKVVVSPVQRQMPSINGNGHRLSIELRDSLIPNTTYTIDFSDAVRDLNEGNVLDGFAFDFSTGDTRDSLLISGMLFDARTLEPAQGMLVGVYSNLSDTAISTLPLERISKTNQYGQFVIRNLPQGEFNIYAINDLNRDYHWDRTEDVAFLGTIVAPSVSPIEVTDTLIASTGLDSIATRPGVQYLPNDLLLTWFNEGYKSQYLKTYARPDSVRVTFEFGAPSDTFPVITLLNTPAAGRTLADVSRLDHSVARDSLTFWLTDRHVIASDTLLLQARYLRTDSLDTLSWTTDTLRLIKRPPVVAKKDKKKKAPNDSIDLPELTFLTFNANVRGQQDLNRPLTFSLSQPLDHFVDEGLHFEQYIDTLWVDLGTPKLERDSLHRQLVYSLRHEWEPSTKYRFTADSAAVVGIYDQWNKEVKTEFTTRAVDDYSTLRLNLSGLPDTIPVMVELLNAQDKPVMTVRAENHSAFFDFINPGTYYARAYLDANDNGRWDTGNLKQNLQPEETYYYPKKLDIKKNWDIAQSWNVTELPIDMQKPNEIKKNKPKTKDKKDNNRRNNPADEEDDDSQGYNPGFGGGRGRQGNSGSSNRGMTGHKKVSNSF